MHKRILQHVRGNVVGYLALFVSLGGVSYAATTLAPANSVNSRAIIDGQVMTPDLAPNAIKADQFCLSGSCVGSKEIANNAVSSSELAPGAVGTTQLAHGAIGTSQIANNAVGSGQVADGSLSGADIANNTITAANVKSGSLTPWDISGGIPPDSPRAWGAIGSGACNADGSNCQLDYNRNVLSVFSPSFDVYCIRVSGASPSTNPIMAGAYHDGDPIVVNTESNSLRNVCNGYGTNVFEVDVVWVGNPNQFRSPHGFWFAVL